MCGICGIMGQVDSEAAEAAVRRMMAALGHRGPDDDGFLWQPPVALGMRRLSIIDLPRGHQPVFNEDGSVAVVLNGEIYNFRELRGELESRGHIFRTRSDTETVVHAFEQWGEDCVHHLRGMFAFAVCELPKRGASTPARLFLARDRFGIKPLYFAMAGGVLLFASEVRALLSSGNVLPRLSRPALESYLLFGSVAEPMTLIEGVYSLPPGHRMWVRPETPPGTPQPEAYWNLARDHLPTESADPDRGEPGAAIGRLRTLLEEAVRLHLISDVPLGVFLSSGIDSTSLVALASREQRGVHTFTVVFSEQEFSEAELARRTAERFATSHQELLLRDDEMLARLDEAVAALDQPSMDGINTYFVSWAARQAGLKVALSGLGGDELFGGYSTFRSTPRLQQIGALGGWLPRPLRAATAWGAVKLMERSKAADAARKLAAFWQEPDALPHPYFFTRMLFAPPQVSALLDGTPAPASSSPCWTWAAEASHQAESLDEFSRVSWLECRSYLVNTLLRDTDAMSMAHSLEVRVPFLDHAVAEFVARLPEQVKRRAGRPKALLVEALQDLLPPEVVSQRKRTFTFPWERWLRGALRQRVQAGLTNLHPALRAALRVDAVAAVWHSFLSGRTSWSRPWSLYVLNEWARRHRVIAGD